MPLPGFKRTSKTGRLSACDIMLNVYLKDEDDEAVVKKAHENLERMSKAGLITITSTSPAISEPSKTGDSFDCATVCRNALEGRPCLYCYVEQGRFSGLRPTNVCLDTMYSREIRGWPPERVDANNRKGGLRMFSYGEYLDTGSCNEKIEQVIEDSSEKGLKLKAITKRDDFVESYVDRVDNVNVSIDSLGMGMRWSKAKELKARHPDKVKIRAMAANREDFSKWVNRPWVDIITPYHGRKGDPKEWFKGEYCVNVDRYDHNPLVKREVEERRAEGEEVNDHTCFEVLKHTRGITNWVKHTVETTPGLEQRVCSLDGEGHCDECLVKCGDDGCHDVCVEWDE